MARSDLVDKLKLQLAAALDARDWEGAALARERLVELVVDAARDSDNAALKDIARIFAGGHASMVFRHDVDPTYGEAAVAWEMRAEANMTEIVRRSVPEVLPLPEEQRGKRDLIILALGRTNRRSINSGDLAKLCDTREETVSRIMPILRSEGLVSTTAAGRHRLHSLTSRGREVAAELRLGAGTHAEPRPMEDVMRHQSSAWTAVKAVKREEGLKDFEGSNVMLVGNLAGPDRGIAEVWEGRHPSASVLNTLPMVDDFTAHQPLGTSETVTDAGPEQDCVIVTQLQQKRVPAGVLSSAGISRSLYQPLSQGR